jgi:hypothetical protein
MELYEVFKIHLTGRLETRQQVMKTSHSNLGGTKEGSDEGQVTYPLLFFTFLYTVSPSPELLLLLCFFQSSKPVPVIQDGTLPQSALPVVACSKISSFH